MSLVLAQRLQKAIQKIQKQHPDAILQLNKGASEADFSALEAAIWLQLPKTSKKSTVCAMAKAKTVRFCLRGKSG